MTTKKNDTCSAGGDAAIADELAPMRKWEGGMSGSGYASGPTHLDRTDFGTGDAAAEETEAGETTADADAQGSSGAGDDGAG